MKICLLFLVPAICLVSCQTATLTPTEEPAAGSFTSEEYGYQFDYPAGAEVEISDESGSQIRVHAGIDDPFQITATRDYFPLDVTFYLDMRTTGERNIGHNRWYEFVLPDGYCDARICALPMYVLKMEAGDVLYTVTFFSQDTTTKLQEQILTTFATSTPD